MNLWGAEFMKKYFLVATMVAFLSTISSTSFAREFVRIVGSATVYPFASLVAERFSRNNNYTSPIVEATGTGGGFAQFCRGVGFNYPDINDASRKITPNELALCAKNGIKNPLAIKIGFDGIVLVYPQSLGKITLTTKELFLALSSKVPSKEDNNKWVANFYKKWSDINPNLPDLTIKVMGPPSTSGTRDTFVELVLKDSCNLVSKRKLTKEEQKIYCGIVRYDGAWQDGSENYSLVLQKVSKSSNLFAIMGYNYYKTNALSIAAANINNVVPDTTTIMDRKYPLSRPLYMYVKQEHLEAIPGLKDFVNELINEDTIGRNGYLAKHGLIPLSAKDYKALIKTLNTALIQ